MPKSVTRFFLVATFLFCSSSAFTDPVLFCKDGPGINLISDGCISGASSHYPGGGDGFYSNTDGGDPESAVEAAILGATGVAVDISLLGEIDFGDGGALSGSWDFGSAVAYITVKAANSFALYDVEGATSGSWTTAGILTNGGQQPGVSHIRLWGTPASVPEPATLGLFGFTLLGLMLARRRN